MLKRLFFISMICLIISGCTNNTPYSPPQQVNSSPTCDPDYAHCSDQSRHEVSQEINNAL